MTAYSERSFDEGLHRGLAASILGLLGYQVLRAISPRVRLFLAGGALAGAGVLLWKKPVHSACGPSNANGPITPSTVVGSPAEMELGEPRFPASDPISVPIE